MLAKGICSALNYCLAQTMEIVATTCDAGEHPIQDGLCVSYNNECLELVEEFSDRLCRLNPLLRLDHVDLSSLSSESFEQKILSMSDEDWMKLYDFMCWVVSDRPRKLSLEGKFKMKFVMACLKVPQVAREYAMSYLHSTQSWRLKRFLGLFLSDDGAFLDIHAAFNQHFYLSGEANEEEIVFFELINSENDN
jgi:hypothetical protein